MVRWLICLLSAGIIFSQDDGLPPNFVYLEPIEDFFARDPISLEVIVTDRNKIVRVSIFYRFNDGINFIQQKMQVSNQPVIFEVGIPLDEVVPGFLQYYFWARDEFGNEATWPSGGEDLPMVLPIYPTKQEKVKEKGLKEIPKLVEGFQPPEKLEDNLPYYLEIGMLAPAHEVTYEEGVPIIVISVYDPEQIVNLESVKLLIDGTKVTSFNSPDMITYIHLNPFEAGYHIVRYEANNISGEMLVKEFSFFMNEKIIDELEVDKITWKEKINFKGDLGWNTNYDPSGNAIDVHKINSSIKFQLGDYKFNLSGLTSTHIYDIDAREEAKHRQPSTRLKFKMKSPYLDLNYGDNSPEFSEFSLKGTRVRGIHTNIKWGTWETSFVSGETKHWVDNIFSKISTWESVYQYQPGDQVYYRGDIWEKVTLNPGVPDTLLGDWFIDTLSNYSPAPNDGCIELDLEIYGLDPIDGGDTLAAWTGSECEQVIVHSTINMMTGNDDYYDDNNQVKSIEERYLFTDVKECLQQCKTPIIYQKGFPIRQLEGFRTSKDFYEHAKFGISAIRSWDVRDENLIPYSILDEYTYEGNMAISGDFMFHFNHDKTVLSGEYGMSMTIDQSYSDMILLKSIHNIDDTLSLYNHLEWDGVDYCYQNQCVDINGDGIINSKPEFVTGVIINDSLWTEVMASREELKDKGKKLGFSINDDIITGYEAGRGVSGLTGSEVSDFINGDISERIDLLLKKPAFKVVFKTPIPLSFTELNFQTELNQAPLNYLSHGSSSIQTDVRNWKNKVGFKLLKNQLNFSFGYDNQIKSPWNPALTDEISDIKRAITDTYSGSIGLSFRNFPGLNYSIRLQNREDLFVGYNEGILSDSTTGLKKMSTHTVAPTYKISMGETNINLNGNISLVYDLDLLSDTTGCYTMTNSTKGINMGGNPILCEGINDYYFSKEYNPLRDTGNHTSTYTGAISFSFSSPLSLNLGWGMSINSPNDLRQSETAITVLSAKLGYKFFDNKLNVTLGGNYVIGFKGENDYWDAGEVLTIDRNGVWNPGEEFIDENEDEKYDEGEIFIDEIANNIYDFENSDQFEDWIDCNDDFSICEDDDNWDNEIMGNDSWNDGETWINEGANETYDPEDAFIDKIELDNWKLTLKSGIQYKIPEQKIAFGLNLDYSLTKDNMPEAEEKAPVFKAKISIKYGF